MINPRPREGGGLWVGGFPRDFSLATGRDWQGLLKPGNHGFLPFQNQIHLPPDLQLSSWAVPTLWSSRLGSWSMWCLLVASSQPSPLLLSVRPPFHPLPTSQVRLQVLPPQDPRPVSSILQTCREEPDPQAPSYAQIPSILLLPFCGCQKLLFSPTTEVGGGLGERHHWTQKLGCRISHDKGKDGWQGSLRISTYKREFTEKRSRARISGPSHKHKPHR